MTPRTSLQRLLRPESIAVVGGRFAEEVIRQCDRIGYAGEIWPVNPHRKAMVGRRCVAEVAALPAAPDATFVGVSREKTIDVVRELAARKAGGAVCYASGYAEVGGEGRALQARLAAAIGDLALVGPNCYGLLNYLDGVALWPDQHGGERVARGAAIVMQSGNIGISLTMQQRALDIAYLISIGNQAGITIPEYIEALLDDGRVTAIGLHIEGLADTAAFSRAAIRALQKRVPIVALKSGTSPRGRELTLTHTRSLAGADQLYAALFERVGVLRVRTFPQFVEALKFLSVVGPLPGNSIASISCSGGEAALMADLSQALDLKFADLNDAQKERLRKVLGARVPLNNPLDYHTYIWGDEAAQYECFWAMLQGEQDITLKVLDYPRADRCDDAAWVKTADAFTRALAQTKKRGAVVSTLPENLPLAAQIRLRAAGVAPLLGMEAALRAVAGASWLHQRQAGAHQIRPISAAHGGSVTATTLTEAASKRLLCKHGIGAPRFFECPLADAPARAAQLGYPVAVKISAAEILHKSDHGGVFLNLQDENQVRAAVGELAELGDHVLVETMAPAPVAELIAGVTREPQFGVALVVGAGGILAELLQDRATLLFPVSRADIEAALGRLRIAPLLQGQRGRPPGDIPALIDALLSLARFAAQHAAEIADIDINPLFVLPAGDGVIAVDAVVRLAADSELIAQ